MKHTRTLIALMLCSMFSTGAISAEAANATHDNAALSHVQYGSMKIVVPITSTDTSVHTMKLRNIENGLESVAKWGGQMQSTVVLYAGGISLVKNPDPETRQQIDALKAKGVKFAVCDKTLREMNIDFHTLYDVDAKDIVPSGFTEVAYLQAAQHYVVDPAN